MRTWLLALVLALAGSAILVGSAFADASTYHSKYSATTRACAGCHRAHTAVSDSLLKSTTIYGLCTSCHGSTNGLDVVDGVEWQTDPVTHAIIPGTLPEGGTKGGGFVNSMMNTGLLATGPTTFAPSTSAHKVNGMPGYLGDTAWGIGAIGSGAGTTVTLECTSCHDPHGQSGVDPVTRAKIPTYRILRSNVAAKVTGAAGSVNVPEDSLTPHDYLVDSTTQVYYGQTYTTNLQVLSQWCATCHTRIHTSGVSGPPGSTNSGDAIYSFRHSTLGSSVENNYGSTTLWPSGSPACVTCHTAHGSSAAMTRQAAEVPKPGTAGGTGNVLDSSLLRVDNRGVCELCHNK